MLWNNSTRTGSDGSFVWTATVTLNQKQDEWQGTAGKIGDVDVSGMTPKSGGTCTISYSQSSGACTIAFST